MEQDMNSHLILAGALLVAGASETVNFDKAEAGKAPSGWTATPLAQASGTRCGSIFRVASSR